MGTWVKTLYWRYLELTYSISFNLSNVSNFFLELNSDDLKDRISVQEKKKEVVAFCSRPPQNLKLGTFPW